MSDSVIMANISSTWHPLVPSHFVRLSDNIVAGYLNGQEFALWRSAAGVVQAWENRCPHRGTRLTLGRIIEDRLSCAYHGWEFDTRGSCAAIPANPGLPLPKQLRVKSFQSVEASGMVWVALSDVGNSVTDAAAVANDVTYVFFARSLAILAPRNLVANVFQDCGFRATGENSMSGPFAEMDSSVLLTEASASMTFAHVWLKSDPGRSQLNKVFAECRRVRRDAEARASFGS